MIKPQIYLAACALLTLAPISAFGAASTISLEDRIDQSFSTLKIDLSEEEARKLKNVKIFAEKGVDEGTEILTTVIDSNGVIHNFYDGLWQKIVHVKQNVPAKPIKALGIGLARDKKSALNAVRKFTGKKNFQCDTDKTAEKEMETKFGSHQFCRQPTAGDGGYIWVEFDIKDRLTRAGYQAWDPF